MGGLLDWQNKRKLEEEAPLAARMRPKTLDEFVGQAHIVGPGRLLRRAIEADQLSSLIFYGPPGTGKTTLARIIANTTQAHFISVNAVLAGVKDLREAIKVARERRESWEQRTILFVDEVHRFNKAQQDALLPWVENGVVLLIGATTENPYFEVNRALVSRSRIFQLKSLEEGDLRRLVARTLSDRIRGYGTRRVRLSDEALDHLVNVANGDARVLLGALELAVETTPPDEIGRIVIDLQVAEESIQQRAVLYDKEGDAHFDIISAYIKSIRGSDPDAALYWLARMVYAGEDPRFILRRLVILASEDVGMAAPELIGVVESCAAAFDRVGMPEGRYHLAQATLVLATAPKSNSVMGFFDALAAIEQEREGEVPNHLKDPGRDKEGFGHGKGYLYPHAYRDHWVEQQYLPSSLQGRVFYRPSAQGYEATIKEQVDQRREAQLAAMVEGGFTAPPEILTWSPTDPAAQRWLQRTMSTAGQRLGVIRDRVFELAAVERHHVVLDLNATSGLMTWEALRRAPEGHVIATVRSESDADALREQVQPLPELGRPRIVRASLEELSGALTEVEPGLRPERLVGRNVFAGAGGRFAETAAAVAAAAGEAGWVVLAESIPRHTQRVYALVEREGLDDDLVARWIAAEEGIYEVEGDPVVGWGLEEVLVALQQAGLSATGRLERLTTRVQLSRELIERWFAEPSEGRPTYASRLAGALTEDELDQLRALLLTKLANRTVEWANAVGFIEATPGRSATSP
ncbi:MAG: AAA family ATPase [Myxococcales bacterium]|nr:AAA family ATPase [Myxococcales bacterium]